MSRVTTIRRIKALKAKSGGNANTKVKASRARRGIDNVLMLIAGIVGVVIAVIIYLFVFGGVTKSFTTTTTPIITAQESSGLLTVNIKVGGVSSVEIYNIYPYSGSSPVTSGCSPSDYYLNGNSAGAPPVTIKPGNTYTVVYSGSACSTVTTVEVVTSSGTYTAPVT